MGIFEEIDHLVNLDVGNRGIKHLSKASGRDIPLCLRSARVLKGELKKGNPMGITTGFPITSQKKPETDGPPGAVMLGKAMKKFDVEPVFLVEKFCQEVMEELLDLTGLEESKVKIIPTENNEIEEFCNEVFNEYNLSSLISVEKPGVAKNGSYYDMYGNEISSRVGKIDELFIKASDMGIPTIGIGDGGNEIGMGNVYDAVKKCVPKGEKIATTTEVGSLVTSGVSNWGAYGILATLSKITDQQLLHDGEFEKEMIKTCIESGAVDGVNKNSEFSVDGFHSDFHSHVVEILRYLGSR